MLKKSNGGNAMKDVSANKLVESCWTAVSKLESQVARNKDLPSVYAQIVTEAFDALRQIEKLLAPSAALVAPPSLGMEPVAREAAKEIARLATATHQDCPTINILRCNIERLGAEVIIESLRRSGAQKVEATAPAQREMIGDRIRDMINGKTANNAWADGELENLRDNLDSLLESVTAACDPEYTALLAMACDEYCSANSIRQTGGQGKRGTTGKGPLRKERRRGNDD